MTLKRIYLGSLVSLGSLLFCCIPEPVVAQCVQSDISVQMNVSRNPNTQRRNRVNFDNEGTCSGNSSTTTGVQVNVGGDGPVRQERNVRHKLRGGEGNPTGVNGPTVNVRSNVGVDVRNPADDLLD
ncbi:hypothetical protein KR51_00023010 [Rubidibacter lacunae KORDI 51-2]|uniref:Uncharacterized protein n=1 Tax=Rubidibacter lacunae KORDI 51-2 TaxID=582515 RepID=U5DKE5_9CHRO|nr:hypothetical protein [Rubidibacter lacunae]ERN41044.1 hypothetical protein KR51_00023010 [Rubidibacter lacunae KORDI 51-2]